MDDKEIKSKVTEGYFQLVYFTPELLLSRHWRHLLGGDAYQKRLCAFVIDEAHCVKKWYAVYYSYNSCNIVIVLNYILILTREIPFERVCYVSGRFVVFYVKESE